eukprot:8476122-Prorocentrum_lima.AAC.1
MAAAAGLLDTRSIGRPRDFSGEEADWHAWVFAFRSYCALLAPGMEAAMERCERMTEELDPESYGDEGVALAGQLYHLLVTLCQKGRAVAVLMGSPRRN